jgi:hypothetical protein
MGSVLFPRVDDGRVVLFFNRWWDADGYFIGPQDPPPCFIEPAPAPAARQQKRMAPLACLALPAGRFATT